MRRYIIEIQDKQYTIDVDDVDASHFRVILDNQTYEVNLSSEEMTAPASQPTPVTSERAPTPQQPPKPINPSTPLRAGPERAQPAPSPVVSKGFRPNLTAPMPGTIQEILVKPGDRVTRGQTIVILEAMKLKNAVKSPQDGVISKVVTEQGKSVRHGDVLVCFEEPAR